MFYAKLNKENICIGISQLGGTVESDTLVALEQYDISLLGKQYQNGVWLTVSKKETEERPTEIQIMMQTLTDIEINTLNAQKERQLLAQQLADVEISILLGGEIHV